GHRRRARRPAQHGVLAVAARARRLRRGRAAHSGGKAMSDDRLTPELQALLAAERDAPGPDGAVRNRVAGRLAKTLGVTLAAAGASSAATSGAQAALPKALVGKSLAA